MSDTKERFRQDAKDECLAIYVSENGEQARCGAPERDPRHYNKPFLKPTPNSGKHFFQAFANADE